MTTTRVSFHRLTHVHIDRTARDCDGRYDRDLVFFPNERETFREMWTWAVMRRVDVSWNSAVTLRRGTDEDGMPFAEYHALTEEGFEHEDIYACDDPRCEAGTHRYRDHTAESMGY